jgi:hypothetical protein
MPPILTRRTMLHLAGAVVTLAGATRSFAAPLPTMTVNKDPNCDCCTGWADHIRAAGFPVIIVAADNLKATRERLGVPDELAGCHTGEVDGYVIEGHVPADAVKRLLAERPAAIGVAVKGMPAGSPGMGGEPEVYEVVLFRTGGRQSFGRYRGADAV